MRNATYTGRETTETPVTPVAPTAPLQQGLVKMPDGSKRMYIDGKVVSVAYPDGVKGPTLNEINAAEGTKTAVPDSNNPVNPVAPVDPGGLPSQIETPTVNPDGTPIQTRAEREAINKQLAGNRGQTLEQFYIDNPWAVLEPEPTTNQPLPFVPGAKSYEYADSGTQATKPTPTPTPTTTTPSGGGPSDYRPRGQEPMQNTNP